MKLSLRTLGVPIAAASGTAIALLACSSEDRGSFTADVPDSGPVVAVLPEAAPPEDSAAPADASASKPPFDPKDEAVTCGTGACAVQIVAGDNHFCARMSDGTVRCWGDDTSGSLGTSDAHDGGADGGDAGDAGAHVIGSVTGLQGGSQISAGGTTTCALVAAGEVRCWGGNNHGQLGLAGAAPVSDTNPHATPSHVALSTAAARVDVGATSACAVLASADTWCWGDNSRRQLARATAETVGSPAPAMLAKGDITRTSASTFSAFGITTKGDIQDWGAVTGTEGCVSARAGSINRDPIPVSIGVGPATSFSVSSVLVEDGTSYAHACAVVNGQVYCWGQSAWGALGNGLPGGVPMPTATRVDNPKAWPQQVAAGGETTCVRLTDGSVQCTGDNERGALGRDPKEAYSMFFEPASAFTGYAVAVATSSAAVCALEKDGSVVCWGSNEHGELGLGTSDTNPHFVPARIAF